MTAQQLYEQDIRSLPTMERLRLAKLILDELRASPEAQGELREALAEAICQATLPNEQLLQMAQAHRPPQSWWDEANCPFQPEQGA